MIRPRSMCAAALLAFSGIACGQVTGPSSSQSPYLIAAPGAPSVSVYSILTAGDSVNSGPAGAPYRFTGIPDGIGSYDNGDGTMTVLVNHELLANQGISREHGGTGSYVSQWTISTTPGADFLRASGGRDLDSSAVTSTNGAGTRNSFSRFCSADLAAPTAFYNPASGLGTQKHLFMNGEESANGRAMAHIVNDHTAYQLTKFDGLNGAWENLLANPAPSDTTLVMANSDGGDNRVFAYVGAKQNSGTDIEKAGLTSGNSFGIQVKVGGVNVAAESRTSGFASSGAPVLSGQFELTPGNSGTSFLRPEDGAWNPAHPNDYYFVTTDRLDTTDGGTGGPAGQAGRSRLWHMHYSDLSNPQAGGTIEALLTGTEGHNMLDNITVVPGLDGHTRILCTEDVGNASHNGKVWMYDATTNALSMVLQHDPARFGDIGLPPTAPFTVDEESSGIIDARDTLGLGWFLIDVQDHHSIGGELVEGGQLLAFYLPSAIPTPGSLALLALSGVVVGRRRR